jgi:vitellogenic carboxypeptidase-like protein
MYYMGYADENERKVLQAYEQKIVQHLKHQEYIPAFRVFDEMLNGDFFKYPTYFTNITGTTNYFNIMMPQYPTDPFGKFLDLPSTRAQLNVGDRKYWSYNGTVEQYLLPDWMRSVANILPPLLENYKVLIYNGNLDIILGPAQTERFLRGLRWTGQHDYLRSKKQIWVGQDGRPAGYVHTVKSFHHIVFLRAGHMVPSDQPQNALDMITRFVNSQPFN